MILGITLTEDVKGLTASTQRWLEAGPPPPPGWLAKVPVVGGQGIRVLEEAHLRR